MRHLDLPQFLISLFKNEFSPPTTTRSHLLIDLIPKLDGENFLPSSGTSRTLKRQHCRFGVWMKLMKSSFFGSQNGLILAAAGILAGVVTFANSSAQALPEKSSTPENKVATAQPFKSLMVKDDQKTDEETKSLPEAISRAIFKDVSDKNRLQASQLRIIQVERQTWTDGCLGLTGGDAVCTQSLMPGWRVVVANGEQRWVYRTNQVGSLVKLDEVATRAFSSSDTTGQTTRREVTTSTIETTQSVTDSRQGTQAVSSASSVSGSQSRTTQARQTLNGMTDSRQGTQASASSQTTQGSTTRIQQTQVARRREVKFTDVSQSYWAKDYIKELAGRGILTGFPDGKFHPNEPVTRAQFAALVASVFNSNKVRNVVNFRDVSSTYWAYEGVRDAYEMGFLEVGSSNDFNPNQNLTRVQVLTALAKGLNYSTSTSTEKVLQYYSDAASIPTNSRSLVAAATERGIVVNYPNVKTCNPNQVATRAEVAAILYQAMVHKGDAAAISTPYIAGTSTRAVEAGQTERGERNKPRRQNCNQGIGNGAEGCDPGNSRPHGGSNDEGGRTPGNSPKK